MSDEATRCEQALQWGRSAKTNQRTKRTEFRLFALSPTGEPVHRLDEANRLIRDGRDMTSPSCI